MRRRQCVAVCETSTLIPTLAAALGDATRSLQEGIRLTSSEAAGHDECLELLVGARAQTRGGRGVGDSPSAPPSFGSRGFHQRRGIIFSTLPQMASWL